MVMCRNFDPIFIQHRNTLETSSVFSVYFFLGLSSVLESHVALSLRWRRQVPAWGGQ